MLTGDTNPWRKRGHVHMYDPYAALEDPMGPIWKHAAAEETARWEAAAKPDYAAWHSSFKRYSAALPTKPAYAQEHLTWQAKEVYIQHGIGHRQHVWLGSRVYTGLTSFGMDPDSTLYYTIQDIGSGAELLELTVYDIHRVTPLWKSSPVGPVAAFQGGGHSGHSGRIFYQTVENHLRCSGVVSAVAATGRGRHAVFHEHDKRYNVDIVHPPYQSDVFIRIYNALSQRIGRIVGNPGHVVWLTPAPAHDADGAGTTLIPINATSYATNSTLVVNGVAVKLPNDQYGVDAFAHETCIMLATIAHGAHSLYRYDKGGFELLLEPKGPNHMIVRGAGPQPIIEVCYPNKPNELYKYAHAGTHASLKQIFRYPEPLTLNHYVYGTATASDGAHIPYTFVSVVARPKRVIVSAYGAYGICAPIGYPLRWLSWLARGYALVVAMPRGGRDDGDAWYNAARGAVKKITTFTDTAAVIQHVQRVHHIKPENTVLYGRSAGGWTAAYVGTHYPQKLGAIYAEVPYLDVLRTTSNPELPLTQLEYDEFGNPSVRQDEYKALQKISPVDTVAQAPPRAPYIIVRTAVNDSQVLAYEAVKWAKKLRAHGWNVLVGIDGNGGHFAAAVDMYAQQAADAALIHAHLARPHVAQTRKVRSHRSKGTTLRRTSSSKHTRKHSTSASAEWKA